MGAYGSSLDSLSVEQLKETLGRLGNRLDSGKLRGEELATVTREEQGVSAALKRKLAPHKVATSLDLAPIARSLAEDVERTPPPRPQPRPEPPVDNPFFGRPPETSPTVFQTHKDLTDCVQKAKYWEELYLEQKRFREENLQVLKATATENDDLRARFDRIYRALDGKDPADLIARLREAETQLRKLREGGGMTAEDCRRVRDDLIAERDKTRRLESVILGLQTRLQFLEKLPPRDPSIKVERSTEARDALVLDLQETLQTNVIDQIFKMFETTAGRKSWDRNWEASIAGPLITIAQTPKYRVPDNYGGIRRTWAAALQYIFIELFAGTGLLRPQGSREKRLPLIGHENVRRLLLRTLAAIGAPDEPVATDFIGLWIIARIERIEGRHITYITVLDALKAATIPVPKFEDLKDFRARVGAAFDFSGRILAEAALAGSHVPGHHDDADGDDDDSSSAEYAEPIYPALPLTEGNEGAQVEWNTTVVNIRSPHTRTSVVANKLATLLSLLDSNPALDRERVRRDVASLKGALAAHKSTTIPGLYRQLSERVA